MGAHVHLDARPLLLALLVFGCGVEPGSLDSDGTDGGTTEGSTGTIPSTSGTSSSGSTADASSGDDSTDGGSTDDAADADETTTGEPDTPASPCSPDAEPGEHAIYFVATDGSDDDPGTIDQPFATMRRGIAAMAGGDRLCIRGGTYDEGCFGNGAEDVIPSGSSWEDATTIAAYEGEDVVLTTAGACVFALAKDEQYVILHGLTLEGPGQDAEADVTLLWISSTVHHIRFVAGEMRDSPGHGTLWGHETHHNELVDTEVHSNGGLFNNDVVGQGNCYIHGAYINGDDHLFEGNEFHDNLGYGLHFYSATDDIINRAIIRGNRIHDNATWGDCSAAGILVTSGSDHLVYNNVVYGEPFGITVAYDAKGARVYNNTVYGCTYDAIQVGETTSGTQVVNNIHFGNGGDVTDSTGQATISANLATDPGFVDAAAGDFHLQPGSPAIDAGVELPEVTDDFDGTPRPQGNGYDVGAFEQR